MTRFYTSLNSFYASDHRRRASRERDFGRRWRGRHGAMYRAAWVRDTGELYVARRGGPVEVFERRFALREVHTALAGYQDVCGRPGSLGWLLERLRHRPVSV